MSKFLGSTVLDVRETRYSGVFERRLDYAMD